MRLTFEALYLHKGARWTHGFYGPPIGSRPLGVEWSRDRWRHVTPKRSRSWPHYLSGAISP